MDSLDILLIITALVFSAGITGLIRIYAKRSNLLDVPNERSSHQVATPRGGGLSIVVVFLVSVIWLYAEGRLPTDVFSSLLVGGALVAGIGFADDHRHVPAKWRLLVQIIAATFALVILGGLPDIQLGNSFLDLGYAGDAMTIIFTVWLVNLYNFMDGIDGIAAVEALCIVGSALIISPVGDGGFIASLLVVFAAAVFGFLAWNWPPAKIFMGDVGSGFIGFVLAILAIVSNSLGYLSIWCWLILAGVFLVDSTVTLNTRLIIGEQWYFAHNKHAYQKAARYFKSHQSVTVSVVLINFIWLLPCAWLTSLRPEFGWWLTLVAWAPIIAITFYLKAGRPESRCETQQ